MKKITRVVAAMAIGATAIGIGIAPPAAADTSNCQTVGAATICGQGSVTNGGQPAAASPGGADAPGAGCTNAYGGYQQCNAGHGH